MSIGHSPSHPKHAPDQRKDDKDVTEQDKQDARRRIQGSNFEETGDDSDDSPPPTQTAASLGSA